jgi:DNA-binding response OmpR family regulator
MKVLVVEDDPMLRELLRRLVRSASFQVVMASNGIEALELAAAEQPEIVLTDWMMPGIEGVDLCRRLRQAAPGQPYTYIILLSVREQKEDIAQGLSAGADDYMIKPFDPVELLARLRVGERIIRLESSLRHRNEELEASLRTIQQLQTLLPICMHCKRIRKDENYWEQIEKYLHEQTGTNFTHGICPECFQKHYPDLQRRRREEEQQAKAQSTERVE